MKLSSLLFWAASAGLCVQFPATGLAAQGEVVEQIHLRAGEPPAVALTADLLYRLLLSEIAAQRGDFDVASEQYLSLAKDTSDPRLAQKAFRAAIIDRNMARANEAAQQWVLLAPGDPEAVASSLALAASNGQTSGMASALWQRIEQADDKDTAILQAAAIISKLNDKQVALDVLERTLRAPVRSLPISHVVLADAAWAAGDATRALGEARKAQALDPRLESAAQRVLEYGMSVNPEAVLAETRAFVQANPESGKTQLLLANHLVRRGDFDGALRVVHDLRRRTPEDFDLLYTEAEINFRADRFDAARSLLLQYINVQTQRRQSIDDRASDAVDDASDARLMLVKIAEKQGDLAEAIRQLELIDDPSLVFQARIHKAVLEGRQGNLAQARRTLDMLKPVDDRERAVIALTLSSILREAGRTEQAVSVLVAADKALPNTSEIKYDLGMLYERQGRYEQFEAMMRRVIELEPDDANAYNSLGYTFVDQDTRLDEARDLLERALELEPDNPYILDSVGWYFYRIGDYPAAQEYLERSYKLMPAADVAAHLGEVLWKQGRRDQAQRVWRAALETDPGNEVLNKTMQRFGVSR
ncbi:MAG TPA: tetratricopeptide repeat protein [Pusillimonas sp.]|uniref:tetratricopeptide repeat protein n=1 Tax=Pusillimonas sp. TaxID=3040095 RepID=UPI002CBA0585|nr:tetratricopeptide repeat protein [Pusillimonas sp.]HUH88188.1 tetratricopeptide repeat protein [Pusillimonas sp.]